MVPERTKVTIIIIIIFVVLATAFGGEALNLGETSNQPTVGQAGTLHRDRLSNGRINSYFGSFDPNMGYRAFDSRFHPGMKSYDEDELQFIVDAISWILVVIGLICSVIIVWRIFYRTVWGIAIRRFCYYRLWLRDTETPVLEAYIPLSVYYSA